MLAGLAATGLHRLADAAPTTMRRHLAPTFVFADLAGYTALTEERGDEAAASLAREFRRTMCALSREHGATQVKSMGDGVMIWAPTRPTRSRSPRAPWSRSARGADLLPVRVGVHTGPAVMRGCDWYGSAVNVAARLAAQAEPNQALDQRGHANRRRWPARAALDDRRESSRCAASATVAAWRLA